MRMIFATPLVFLAGSALAQSTTPPNPPSGASLPTMQHGQGRERLKHRFAEGDTNHDGLLSRDEALAAFPRLANRFDTIDTNHDGFWSLNELSQYLRANHQARHKPTP